jgi:hypothetical protein
VHIKTAGDGKWVSCFIVAGTWGVCTDDIYFYDQRGPLNMGPARRVAEQEFYIFFGQSPWCKHSQTSSLSSHDNDRECSVANFLCKMLLMMGIAVV